MSKRLIIPFFIPHAGCPFTCVFCNQWGISGAREYPNPAAMAGVVREYLQTDRGRSEKREAAFFGGSFTGLPKEVQEGWLAAAGGLIEQGLLTGIRLSTRPDYIQRDNLQMLKEYGVTVIELGVQSFDDEVLLKSRRGYGSDDVGCATRLLREYPFELGFQLMLGLPGDSGESVQITGRETVKLKPDFVRIYPTVVLKDTLLEEWYNQGIYQPWTLQQAVEAGAEWLSLFSLYGIDVIRLGLQATEGLVPGRELVAGPYHPAFGELVANRVLLKQLLAMLAEMGTADGSLTIACSPDDLSKVIGQKRSNIAYLERAANFGKIRLEADETLAAGDLLLRTDSAELLKTRKEYLERYRI